MGKTTEDLVLQVSATQELLERQLREMGRNVETFDQAAEQRLEQLQQRFSGLNLGRAVDAVRDADRAFKSSFDTINRQASELAQSLAKNGSVDLRPMLDQSRARAAALSAESTVLQELARAERSRLGPLEQLTIAERASLAAATAAVSASEQRAAAAAQEVGRLEALAIEMNALAGTQARQTGVSNAQRYALVGVGQQFGDFFVQVGGGTSAIRAFIQQAPQLLGAVQMMGFGAEEGAGKFAAFARFLNTGWGIALTAAIPLVGIFAQNIFSMGAKADEAKPKIDALASAIRGLTSASGRVDYIQYGDVQAQILLKQAQLRKLDGDIKQREGAQALSAAGSDQAYAYSAGKIADLKKQRDALQGEIGALQTTLAGVDKQIQARNKLDQASRDQAAEDKAARDAASAAKKAANARVREEEKAQREAQKELDQFYKRAADTQSDLINGRVVPLKPSGILGENDNGATDKMTQQITEAMDRSAEAQQYLAALAKGTKTAWTESAQAVLSSVQQMKTAFSGDFLDILSAALGIFTQLGGLGLFGKSIQTNILHPTGPQFRAGGGPVQAGAPYIVGEKGPELFVPSASGNIVANDNLRAPNISAGSLRSIGASRAAAVRILVEANDYFTARVQQEAAGIAAPVGAAAAQGGAALAGQRSARAARNRIPGTSR